MERLEAIERLSKLPLWRQMGPANLESIMARVRNNPKVVDMLESESENAKKMAGLVGSNGEMPGMDVMRAVGDIDVEYFDDKHNPDIHPNAAPIGGDGRIVGSAASVS